MSAALAWNLTEKLVALVLILQSLELLSSRRNFSGAGLWTWSILRTDFRHYPTIIRRLLDMLLGDRSFPWVLGLQLVAAIGLACAYSPSAFVLFFTALATSFRWRGAYNGGADSMALVLLSALCWAACFSPEDAAIKIALVYIAVHSCLSYTLAGLAKIRQPSWRSGAAFNQMLRLPQYAVPPWLQRKSLVPCLQGLSFLVLLFELTFPLQFLGTTWSLAYLSLGLVFHLGIAYAFGLNRFLYAWLATYPALFYWAGS